jgi:PqqD family protein of HPr-rel-A system
VVYDALAGSTHLLDPVAAAVLDCLWGGDRSSEAVAAAVRCEFPEDNAEDVLDATHAALAKLRAIHLVRSAEE